jgi:O-antigen/teichoic acid export membrane protein
MKLLLRILRDDFWKSVGILTSGNFIAQLLGILSTPLITRIYSPSDFGLYAIIASISAITINFISLGLPSAIMLEKDHIKAKETFTIIYLISFCLATFLLAISLLFYDQIGFLNPGINTSIFLLLIYLMIIVNSLKGYLTLLVNKFSYDKVLFFNSIIGSLSTIFISIPIGLLGYTMYGLIIASLISGLISILQMISRTSPFIRNLSIPSIFFIFKKYKKFLFYQYPSNFLEILSSQLPSQFFSIFYGYFYLGNYSINERLIGIPSRLIGEPLNSIYFRTANDYINNDKNLARFTFSLISRIMLVSFLPSIIVILFGPQLFSFFLGDQWTYAGEISKYLFVLYVFTFTSNVTSYLRVSLNKQFINLLSSSLKFIIVLLMLFLANYFDFDFISMIKMLVLFMSLYNILDMTINFILLKSYSNFYLLISLSYLIFTYFILQIL